MISSEIKWRLYEVYIKIKNIHSQPKMFMKMKAKFYSIVGKVKSRFEMVILEMGFTIASGHNIKSLL